MNIPLEDRGISTTIIMDRIVDSSFNVFDSCCCCDCCIDMYGKESSFFFSLSSSSLLEEVTTKVVHGSDMGQRYRSNDMGRCHNPVIGDTIP